MNQNRKSCGVGLDRSDARGCQACAYDSPGVGQNKGRLAIGGGEHKWRSLSGNHTFFPPLAGS